MSEMIVLRLEGESSYLLVDPTAGTVQRLDAVDTSASQQESGPSKRFQGVAEAFALPAVPNVPSRKFYLS